MHESPYATRGDLSHLESSDGREKTPNGVEQRTSLDIDVPVEIVWSVVADVERWHEWTPTIARFELLDKGLLRPGTRALIRQPRHAPAIWEIAAIDPGRRIIWRTGIPGIWITARISLEPVVDGTRATLALCYEGVIGRIIGRIMHAANSQSLDIEVAGLKQRSESVVDHPASVVVGMRSTRVPAVAAR